MAGARAARLMPGPARAAKWPGQGSCAEFLARLAARGADPSGFARLGARDRRRNGRVGAGFIRALCRCGAPAGGALRRVLGRLALDSPLARLDALAGLRRLRALGAPPT